MKKRVLAVLLLTMISLSGCNNKTLKDIPLVSALTQKELTDYYKDSVGYKIEVVRNAGVSQQKYEMNEVTKEVNDELVTATKKVENNLSAPVWNNQMYVTENMHQYVKAILDDKILTPTNEYEVKESQGHYFVTAKYKVSPQATGTMGNNRYLGIHGAYSQDAFDNILLDTVFTKQVDDTLLIYNTGDVLRNTSLPKEKIESIIKERIKNTTQDVSGNTGNEIKLVNIDSHLRTPKVDIELVNKLLGSSVQQTAIMPPLTSVYQPVAINDRMSGYGIYPQGGMTLAKFGYNRSEMEGEMALRFVFKKGLVDTTKLEFKNVYIVSYELKDTINKTSSAVIPEFLNTKVAETLERADRCLANNDLAGLMNAKVYGDTGVAVLSGFFNKYGYLQQHISALTKVLDRDVEGNNYLISFTTSRQEGAKGGEDYSNHKYTGYAVISQVGNDFVITDYLYTKCELTREPNINVDDTLMKRLASLVNAGLIGDGDKENINKLIDYLYQACTERYIDRMQNCYNNDLKLLSSTRKEYLVSQLVKWLTAKGMEVQSTYKGFVCEWIGGTDEQAEFLTQELITFAGMDTGMYLKNYYLVSKYGDNWLIDDSQLIETKEVYGDELKTISDSIDKKQIFSVSNAVTSDSVQDAIKEMQEEQLQEQSTVIEPVEPESDSGNQNNNN